MQIKTDGLILRELNVGESDRIVTILTRQKGIIRASARGARRVKSRLSTATQMLCYADLTLFRGKDKYIIDEAEPAGFFLGVRGSLDRLALAQYFAELEMTQAPQEEPAELWLRLMLNALHLIETDLRPQLLVKAAFEMRLLTIAGYMPDLVACGGCGAYEDEEMFFFPSTGGLLCRACAGKTGRKDGCRLSKGALAALRHTVYADFEKLFSFTLPEKPLRELASASEHYLLFCLERTFTTLEFYRGLAAL